jgi:hypothetical protein
MRQQSKCTGQSWFTVSKTARIGRLSLIPTRHLQLALETFANVVPPIINPRKSSYWTPIRRIIILIAAAKGLANAIAPVIDEGMASNRAIVQAPLNSGSGVVERFADLVSPIIY